MAVAWFLESFRRFNKTEQIPDFEADVLKNLAYVYSMLSKYSLFMHCNDDTTELTIEFKFIETFQIILKKRHFGFKNSYIRYRSMFITKNFLT